MVQVQRLDLLCQASMPARLALVRLRLQFEGSVQLSATVLAEETVPVGAARKITPRTAALSLACSRSLHLPTACCPLPPSTPPFLALSLHSTTRLMPLRAVLQRRTSSTIGLPDATQAMILPAQFPHVDTQSLFCCTRPLSVGCKQVSASALGVDNCSRSSKPQEQEQEEEQPQGAAAAAAAAAAAEAAAAAAAAAAGPCFVGHLLGAVRALHHLPSRLRVLRPAGRPGGEKWEQCSCHERGRTGGEQAKNSRRTGGEQAMAHNTAVREKLCCRAAHRAKMSIARSEHSSIFSVGMPSPIVSSLVNAREHCEQRRSNV